MAYLGASVTWVSLLALLPLGIFGHIGDKITTYSYHYVQEESFSLQEIQLRHHCDSFALIGVYAHSPRDILPRGMGYVDWFRLIIVYP